MSSHNSIFLKVIEARKKKGITQLAMAEHLGMCERNYRRLERGEIVTLDIDTLSSIAKLLEMVFIIPTMDPAVMPSDNTPVVPQSKEQGVMSAQQALIVSQQRLIEQVQAENAQLKVQVLSLSYKANA